MNSFFALLDYYPKMSYKHNIDKRSASESANSNITRYKKTLAFLKRKLAIAQEHQAKLFNKHATEQLYNMNKWVYLDCQNIKMTWPNQKLDWKFIEPFQILKKYSKNVYWLNLPANFKFHDVFHISLLEKNLLDREIDLTTIDIDASVKSQDEYVVENIIDSQIFNKNKIQNRASVGLYYLIHWINQLKSERTWEHVTSVKYLKRFISQFHHCHSKAVASVPKPWVRTKRKESELDTAEPESGTVQPRKIQPMRTQKKGWGAWVGIWING